MAKQFAQHDLVLADSATHLNFTLNTSSSVHVMAADPDRRFMAFSLDAGVGVTHTHAYIRFMTSSLSSSVHYGIAVDDGTPFVMMAPVIYTGAISAIAESDNPELHAVYF